MEKILFWIVITLFSLYGLIPGLVTAVFGFGVFLRGSTCHELAFTFDDGPDPRYTLKLLDLLKKHEMKATFFVLGSKAEKYPELVQRMHQEGHLIGLHNYTHRTNWFMTPWTIHRKLDHSATIIEEVTGVRPVHYRPPWGLLNLLTFYCESSFKSYCGL